MSTEKQVKADEPLSIADGAPRAVTLECGAKARLFSAMDYRIIERIHNDVKGVDEIDEGMCLLYCACHTTPKQIGKLWKLARNPKKLYDTVIQWTARTDVTTLTDAIEELGELSSPEYEEDNGESDGAGGKKKTTSQ